MGAVHSGKATKWDCCMMRILILRSGKIILRIVGAGLYNSLKTGIVKLVSTSGAIKNVTGSNSINNLQLQLIMGAPDITESYRYS